MDKFSSPSEAAVPLLVNACCVPLSAVGRAIDCTRWPVVGLYSSMKVGVAALLKVPLPSPTRHHGNIPRREPREHPPIFQRFQQAEAMREGGHPGRQSNVASKW